MIFHKWDSASLGTCAKSLSPRRARLMAGTSCWSCCPSGLFLLSNVTSFYKTVKCLIFELGPCEVTVSVSRALTGLNESQNHRLEKTSKIIKSNHHPNTTMPTKPKVSRSASSASFLNTSRDGDSTTSLGSLFQCLATVSVKKFFLISNLNSPDTTWGHCLSSYH